MRQTKIRKTIKKYAVLFCLCFCLSGCAAEQKDKSADINNEQMSKKDSEEMNRIRKFLYATGLWNSLSELDSLLEKWRKAAEEN